MPTKILYVVGDGSAHDNIELKWSLRSLERCAIDIVEPVIVGSVPEWFKGDAVTCDDVFNRKEKNINRKIVYALKSGLVTGEFQISADDHFWLKKTQFMSLPIYFREPILPDAVSKGGNNYERSLVGTRKTLLGCGITAMNTTCHCNAWASSSDLAEALGTIVFADSLAAEYGVAAWALWPNLRIVNQHYPRHEIAFRRDVKYRGEPDFYGFIHGSDMFSINDSAFANRDFVRFMEDRYGAKCRWE